MKKLIIAILFLKPLLVNAQEISSEPDAATFITNGEVKSITSSGNTVYIGGSFTSLGPNTGGGGSLSPFSDLPDPHFPRVNGSIKAVEPDGNGGWYIGGIFDRVGVYPRQGLAHILADGNVDPLWKPTVDSLVVTIHRANGRIYIGGAFKKINGVRRNNLAAISESNGSLLSWDPNPDNYVFSLLATGNGRILVGGFFASIGQQLRSRLAEVSESNGLATSWNPQIEGAFVSCLDTNAGKIYVGGTFNGAGGQARNNAACFPQGSNEVNAWNPNPNQVILDFAFPEDKVILAGGFSSVGGLNQSQIAMVDNVNGQLIQSWSPQVNGNVVSLQLSNDTLYFGGNFSNIGTNNRNYLAAILVSDATNVLPWNPQANNTVWSIKKQGNAIYTGGEFTSLGMIAIKNLAALDASTGLLKTDWMPNPAGTITLLKAKNGVIYSAGGCGSFSVIDSASGQCNSYGFGSINDMAFYKTLSSDYILLAGSSGIQKFNISTGNLESWQNDPSPSGSITALAVRGNTIYLAGNFTFIGGQSRNGLAAISAITGSVNSWNPGGSNGTIRKMLTGNSVVYVAGDFSYVGGIGGNNGIARANIACISTVGTGSVTSWNPIANQDVYDLQRKDTTSILAAGSFYYSGQALRNYVVELDEASGQATSWNPTMVYSNSESASCIHVTSQKIWVGGKINSMGEKMAKQNLASYSLNPPQTQIQFVSGGALICNGDSTVLDAGIDGISYTWFPFGQNTRRITVKSTANYSVLVRASDGRYARAAQPVSVTTIPAQIQASGDTVFCAGDSVRLTAADPDYSYKWTANGDPAQTTRSITVKKTNTYKLTVSGSGCSAFDSVYIRVKPIPSAAVDSSGALTICKGDPSIEVCGPPNSSYSFRWFKNDNRINLQDSSQSLWQCLSLTEISQSGAYRLSTSLEGCNSPLTPPLLITIKPTPSKPVVRSSGPLIICENECVTLKAPPANGNYDQLLWSTGENTDSISVCNSVGVNLTVFRNGCPATSNLISVTTKPLPPKPVILVLNNNNPAFCLGDTISVTGPFGFRYRWNNADTNMVTRVSSTQNLRLRIVSEWGCISPPSDSIPVIAKPLTALLSQPQSDTVCYLAPFQFSVAANGFNLNYKWYRNGSPVDSSFDGTYVKSQADLIDTGFYFVRVSGDCGNAESQAARLTVPYFQRARLDSIPSRLPCIGDSVLLKAANPIGGASFRWYRNGSEIISAPSRNYYITGDSGYYYFRQFIGECGSPRFDSLYVRYRNKPRPPIPSVSINQQPALCNEQFSLSFNPAAGSGNFQWFSDTGAISGANGSSFTGTALGNYTVQVEAIENGEPNGCISKSVVFPVNFTGPAAVDQPKINTVSVVKDNNQVQRNLVAWRRPAVPDSSVLLTRIYRQTSVSGQYEPIGVVTGSDTSFLDSIADPLQKPWFYKIAAEAYCSNNSGPTYQTALSPYHKTIHLIIVQSANTSALNLIWTAYEGFPVSSYRIFRGLSPDALVFLDSVAGNVLSYTDFPPTAANYYYGIEAETDEEYIPWGRPWAELKRKVKSNSRPITQSIVAGEDSTLNPQVVDVIPVRIEETTVRIYPNPSGGRVFVEGGRDGAKWQLHCYDVLGRKQFSHSLEGNFMDQVQLPPEKGVYFMEIQTERGRKRFRILRH